LQPFAAFPAPLDLHNLAVVLVSPRNPLNIGAAARAMSNFGGFDLRLVAVHGPSFREARSAVGPSSEIVRRARVFPHLADAIADCSLVLGTLAPHKRLPDVPFLPLTEAAAQVRETLQHSRVALLFGPEKTGLSNDSLSYCHAVAGIPARPEHASMNLGQAVAVCLYELSREMARTTPASTPDQPSPSAPAEHLDRITALLRDSLDASGNPVAEDQLRRLVRRLQIDTDDAVILTGFLRKILWKLQHPNTK
jgi:TrmH family RNA methyltransferase